VTEISRFLFFVGMAGLVFISGLAQGIKFKAQEMEKEAIAAGVATYQGEEMKFVWIKGGR
jgi:hypothetical protein